jgi:hypothetical protein
MVVYTDLTVPRRASTKIIRACLVTLVTDWGETHLEKSEPFRVRIVLESDRSFI